MEAEPGPAPIVECHRKPLGVLNGVEHEIVRLVGITRVVFHDLGKFRIEVRHFTSGNLLASRL